MAQSTLSVTLIQPHIAWEDKQQNFSHYDKLIAAVEDKMEVVVLPEMFATGFSMEPQKLAEPENNSLTLSWMRSTASKYRIILTGSVIIEEDDRFYNRLIWMQPDGRYFSYSKRHLFGYAGEDEHYQRGDRKLVVQVNGWKICPLICYDLRFPVWSRYAAGAEYDVLLYVANWPQRRIIAWKALLQARAIENQCYAVGVNRVGEDGNKLVYSGNSNVFGPLGEPLLQLSDAEEVSTIMLSKEELDTTRDHLPFLKDADRFILPD